MDAPVVQQVVNEMSGSNLNSTARTFNLSETTTKGSPMALSVWTPGTLTFQTGKSITNGLMNYNVMSQEVWVKRSARDSARYTGASVKTLELQLESDNQPIRYEHLTGVMTDEAALKTGLVRVVYQGPYSLVYVPVKRFQKAPTSQGYGQGQNFDEYRDESAYYIIRPDKTAERVKLNRKAIANALQSKGAAFETVLKDKKLDPKVEADVVTALGGI